MCEAGDIGAFFASGPSHGRGGVAGEGSASGALVGIGTDEAGALDGAESAGALVGTGAEASREAWNDDRNHKSQLTNQLLLH